MSPEERQLLTALFDRVQTASSTPRDREAEALIEEQTRQRPYSTYYLAQAVIVQEKGLEAASHRIQELEARVHELENAGGDQRQTGGGFLSSIFGSSDQPRQESSAGPWSRERQDRIPVSPHAYRNDGGYANNDDRTAQQTSGPWSSGQAFGGQPYAPSAGGSFLKGALGTAAGVAGGMLLANSLSGIFSNHVSGLGWGSAAEGAATFGGAPVEETVINNYYGDAADGNDRQEVSDDGRDDNDIQQADYGNDDDDNGSSDFGSGDDNLDV